MKSPRFSATNLDQSQHRLNKLSLALIATTFIAASQLLAVLSASAVPTPEQPSPIVPTRTILNGSFESPALSKGAGYSIPQSYNNQIPVIWQTTEKVAPYTDALEIWSEVNTGAGGQSATSGAGSQYAELNGSSNAALYQDICVLPGEAVGWSLRHAARKLSSTNPTNIMQVSITDPSIWSDSKTPPSTKLYNSGNLSTSYNDSWQPKTGTWNSTNANPQALRFAFQAIQGSDGNITYGNFIDDVKLNLSPLIDFLPTNGGNVNLATTTEGNPTPANPPYYYLSLRINGVLTGSGSVKINLTGLNTIRNFTLGSVLKGSALAPTGLSASKSGNEITLNIPAGTYDANSVNNYIHIPIDFSDTIKTRNDNLTFTLSNPAGGGSGSTLAIGSTNCSSAPRTTVDTLLVDDDYTRRL
jgi:trimeric autotransporter adhesin